MRRNLIRGLLVLAVVLAAAAPAAAQSIVRGRVVDANNQPVEGATVTIEADGANRRVEAKTDRTGSFTQVGLPTGAYRITVVKDALKASVPVMVSQGRPTDIVIPLTPNAGLSPEEAKEAEAMRALVQSAVAALNAGRDDEAIASFNQILLKVPTCSDCYFNLGTVYTRKMQYMEAEAAFLKVIEITPNSSEAYTGLANLYNAQRRFDQAAQASAKAAELSAAAGGGGANAETLYNQGVILWNAGKFAEAKAQFENAIKADPRMAMAHYQLGMANLNLGQIAEARAAFQEYLKVDPNGPKAAEVKVFVSQLPQ